MYGLRHLLDACSGQRLRLAKSRQVDADDAVVLFEQVDPEFLPDAAVFAKAMNQRHSGALAFVFVGDLLILVSNQFHKSGFIRSFGPPIARRPGRIRWLKYSNHI